MHARPFLLVWGLALACGCSRPLTEQEQREHDSVNPIQGFVDQKDLDKATFTVTTVQYFGGFTTRTEFQAGKATVTKSGSMVKGAFEPSPRVYTLTAADQQAWGDVINLIVREELWNQGDVKTTGAADGGEVIYEFKVGEHEGKFKLINSSPENLQVFRAKAHYLVNLVEARLDGTVPKK